RLVVGKLPESVLGFLGENELDQSLGHGRSTFLLSCNNTNSIIVLRVDCISRGFTGRVEPAMLFEISHFSL
ncbi:MAG: hypothetical protein QGH40_14470, partial [bacterium]|nr:hypothetical protein [bacterium]